jgi:DNA-dependent protein kinase catalytic subunit
MIDSKCKKVSKVMKYWMNSCDRNQTFEKLKFELLELVVLNDKWNIVKDYIGPTKLQSHEENEYLKSVNLIEDKSRRVIKDIIQLNDAHQKLSN